jgi:hypothetical protein
VTEGKELTLRMPSVPAAFWVALAGALAMVIGAFAPWARVLGIVSVSGTNAGEGWIVIIAAIVAAVVVWLAHVGRRRYLLAIAILAAVAGAATAGYDLGRLRAVANAGSRPPFAPDIVSAGWGIYLALIASIAVGIATIVLWVQLQRGARPTA